MPAPIDLKRKIKGKDNGLGLPPMPEVFTAAELQKMTFPEPSWIVPGVIPEGVTLLAGKAKVGKSYMILNIALALACGGVALGKINVEQKGVLYLCLEDRKRRLQDRISALFPCSSWPENFHMALNWPRVDQGGLPLLQQFLEKHRDVKLVILDTLAKVKARGSGPTRSAYDLDYELVDGIKTIADTMGVSIVIVHHLRKLEAEDPFDCISGSTGLTGAVDTAAVLKKEHGKGKLYIRGRDVEEQELVFDRDPSGGWTLLGDFENFAVTEERAEILGIFKDAEGLPLTINNLCKLTGRKRQNIYKMLNKLADDGLIKKIAHGQYAALPKLLNSSSNQNTNNGLHGLHGLQRVSGLHGLQPNQAQECNPPTLEHGLQANPHEQRATGECNPRNPCIPYNVKCVDCLKYQPDEKPNFPGTCTGNPHDGDSLQLPQVMHSCENFQQRRAQ